MNVAKPGSVSRDEEYNLKISRATKRIKFLGVYAVNTKAFNIRLNNNYGAYNENSLFFFSDVGSPK